MAAVSMRAVLVGVCAACLVGACGDAGVSGSDAGALSFDAGVTDAVPTVHDGAQDASEAPDDAPLDGAGVADAGLPDDPVRALADAMCAAIATCGGAPPGLEAHAVLASDPAGCARVLVDHPELGPVSWLAGFARGDLTLDSSAVPACVEAIAAAGCPWGPFVDSVERACKPAFHTRFGLAPGDACLDEWGCATGCSCEPPSATCPASTCAYQVTRGQPCTAPVQCLPTYDLPLTDCLPLGPGGSGVCGDARLAPLAAAGERCGRVAIEAGHGVIARCEAGLFCDVADGLCHAVRAAGAPCGGATPGWCATGLVCAGGVCRTLVLATRAGDACGASGADGCAARLGLGCDGASCVAIGDGALGSACVPVPGACVSGFYCDAASDACAPVAPEGAPCSSSVECATSSCIASTCGPTHVCD